MADRIVVMNHGVIEQVGTPEEIYGDPVSAFVADFIGTMNFLPGRICDGGRVRLGQVELACTTDGLAQDSAVTLAIRPEDILLQGVAEGDQNALQVTIAEAEFLGSFIRAELAAESLGEQRLTADFSSNLVRRLDVGEGDQIRIALPKDFLRVYPQGGTRG